MAVFAEDLHGFGEVDQVSEGLFSRSNRGKTSWLIFITKSNSRRRNKLIPTLVHSM
jgi:hypothetical protein